MRDLPQKPISILKVLLWLVVGVVIGGIVGAVCGIALTMALTALTVAINPDDPTAGSVAIIIVALNLEMTV